MMWRLPFRSLGRPGESCKSRIASTTLMASGWKPPIRGLRVTQLQDHWLRLMDHSLWGLGRQCLNEFASDITHKTIGGRSFVCMWLPHHGPRLDSDFDHWYLIWKLKGSAILCFSSSPFSGSHSWGFASILLSCSRVAIRYIVSEWVSHDYSLCTWLYCGSA